MRSFFCATFLLTALVSFSRGFNNNNVSPRWRISTAVRPGSTFLRASNDEESLKVETSFGADAVPEGQRPVNEFLDVTSQPMFGWASLESGNKGLLTRLAIVYSVFYGVV